MYREEAETLRERAGRLPRLQEELRRCRERLQAAEACKGQLEVSREAGLRGRGLGAGSVCKSPAGDGLGLRSEFGPGEEGVRLYRGSSHGWAKWARWCLGKGPLDGADGEGGWVLWVRVGPGGGGGV